MPWTLNSNSCLFVKFVLYTGRVSWGGDPANLLISSCSKMTTAKDPDNQVPSHPPFKESLLEAVYGRRKAMWIFIRIVIDNLQNRPHGVVVELGEIDVFGLFLKHLQPILLKFPSLDETAADFHGPFIFQHTVRPLNTKRIAIHLVYS